MAQAILADINIEGQVRDLLFILEGPQWREVWEYLNLPLRIFRDLGLAADTPDSDLWQLCQEREILLITGNRNADGPDSLEATIRTRNTPDSLPVFTVSDPQQLQHSRDYARRVAEKLLEYLLEIDRVRGTGRLFLP